MRGPRYLTGHPRPMFYAPTCPDMLVYVLNSPSSLTIIWLDDGAGCFLESRDGDGEGDGKEAGVVGRGHASMHCYLGGNQQRVRNRKGRLLESIL